MKSFPHSLAGALACSALILGCGTSSDGGEPGGMGGMGGEGGMGGMGGDGPASACVAASARCVNAEFDPVSEDTNCKVDSPPILPEACDGTESLKRPVQCAKTDEVIAYQLTAIALDEDCNSGYDLDGCDGDSCKRGDFAPEEGADGVDNGLAALADFVGGLGTNMGVVNQAYYDSLCGGFIDIQFVVDANAEDNCATVVPVIDGEPKAAVAVNVSDDGCLSGNLGNINISFGGADRLLRNVHLMLTLSPEGFANGRLGATLDRNTASSIAGSLLGAGANLLVSRVLDIDQDLGVNPDAACDALSLALKIGGVATE